jgi:hypothetical protein
MDPPCHARGGGRATLARSLRKGSFLPLVSRVGATHSGCMTTFAAFAVLFLAAATLLVLAGRESLRVNGFAPRRVRDLGDLVHLASLGYSALDDASRRATRRRLTRPF